MRDHVHDLLRADAGGKMIFAGFEFACFAGGNSDGLEYKRVADNAVLRQVIDNGVEAVATLEYDRRVLRQWSVTGIIIKTISGGTDDGQRDEDEKNKYGFQKAHQLNVAASRILSRANFTPA